MTPRTSTRSIAGLALFALASLMILWFGTKDRIADPCADPVAQAEMTKVPGVVNAAIAKSRPGDIRMILMNGDLRAGAGEIAFTMSRSTRSLDLASRSLSGLKVPIVPVREWRSEIEVDRERVEIAWATQPYLHGVQLVGRIFFLGNELNPSPLRWFSKTAMAQLLEGTIPTTLYRAEGVSTKAMAASLESDMTNWLAGAVRHHRATCGRS